MTRDNAAPDAEWLRRIVEPETEVGQAISDGGRQRILRIADTLDRRAELELTRQLHDLAVALHRRWYPEVTQWKPLEDAQGLLSQIDNMTTGAVRADTLDRRAELEDEAIVSEEMIEAGELAYARWNKLPAKERTEPAVVAIYLAMEGARA